MSLALARAYLKFARGGLLAWGLGLFAYALLVLLLYPTMREVPGFQSYWEALPQAFKEAIGATELGAIFGPTGVISLEGFLGTEFLAWWPMMLAVYAVLFLGGGVAREAERGTLELLLSHPLHRYQVVNSKFAVFLVALGVLAGVSYIGVVVGLLAISEALNQRGLLLALLQGGLILAAVGSYSTLFSCWFLDPRRALTAAGLLTAGLYALNLIAPALGSFQWLQKLSLFYYFQAPAILQGTALNLAGAGISLAVTVACLMASWLVFQRRDITR